jgi:hypothetical protein
MMIKRSTLAVFAFLAFTCVTFAQTVTNAVVPAVTGLNLPQSKTEFWVWGIALVTPLIVAGVKKVVPKIPKLLLPIATPFIGIGLGALLNWLQKSNLGWVDMAQAGALAVFVREIVDQAARTDVVQNALGRAPVPPVPPAS